MNRTKYDRLYEFAEAGDFLHLIGWALWNDEDINDVSMFEKGKIKSTLPLLNENIVIMGLNASDSGNNRREPWAGFHNRHSGGRDSWLRELSNADSRIKGAYMTDVFKHVDSNSARVKKKINDDERLRSEQFNKLKKELELLGDNLTIILVGRDAEKYFKRFVKEKRVAGKPYHLIPISHYAGRITKKKFLESASNKIKEMLDK